MESNNDYMKILEKMITLKNDISRLSKKKYFLQQELEGLTKKVKNQFDAQGFYKKGRYNTQCKQCRFFNHETKKCLENVDYRLHDLMECLIFHVSGSV